MNIVSFGGTDRYSAPDDAYTLPLIGGGTDWPVEIETIELGIAGAGGTYDLLGASSPMPKAYDVTRKGNIVVAGYSDIDTSIAAIKKNTILKGRQKLWRVHRNVSISPGDYYWTWAKCKRVQNAEVAGQNFLSMPIELTFRVLDGVWYHRDETVVNSSVPSTTHSIVANNEGDYPVPGRIQINATSGSTTNITVTNTTDNNRLFSFTGTVVQGQPLIIDTAAYTVINGASSGYANFSATRVEWLRFLPGNNTITIAAAANCTVTLRFFRAFP